MTCLLGQYNFFVHINSISGDEQRPQPFAVSLALLFRFLDEQVGGIGDCSRGTRSGRVISEPKTMMTSRVHGEYIRWTKCFTSFIRKVWSVVAAAKDLRTRSTLLKTPGNLWNDNNNIDLFYLGEPSGSTSADNSSGTKTFAPSSFSRLRLYARHRRRTFRI